MFIIIAVHGNLHIRAKSKSSVVTKFQKTFLMKISSIVIKLLDLFP